MKKCKEDKKTEEISNKIFLSMKRRRRKEENQIETKGQKEAIRTFILKEKMEKERMKKKNRRGRKPLFHQTI